MAGGAPTGLSAVPLRARDRAGDSHASRAAGAAAGAIRRAGGRLKGQNVAHVQCRRQAEGAECCASAENKKCGMHLGHIASSAGSTRSRVRRAVSPGRSVSASARVPRRAPRGWSTRPCRAAAPAASRPSAAPLTHTLYCSSGSSAGSSAASAGAARAVPACASPRAAPPAGPGRAGSAACRDCLQCVEAKAAAAPPSGSAR